MTSLRRSEAAEARSPGRAVVLNLARLETQQSPYVFDGPSFEIWTRIDGTRSREDIAAELAALYAAPAEQVAADVDAFVDQLVALGLVEDTDTPPR